MEAVTGRKVLYYGEVRRMIAAENVVLAYLSRKSYENWGKWAQEHPDLEKILNEVEVLNATSD